jgi:hypothetical protein
MTVTPFLSIATCSSFAIGALLKYREADAAEERAAL